jgi:hypothetical protein
MEKLSKQQAIQQADQFIASQTLPPDLTAMFQSIREYEGKYLVQYEKIFVEPRKESPPYLLVIVEPSGEAHWGNP